MTAKVICPHRDAPCRRGCQLGTFCRIGPSREACEAAIRPGNPMGQVFDAHAEVFDRHGFKYARFQACGYGMGAIYNPIWVDFPMFYHGNPLEMEEGNVFFLHMILLDDRTGLTMSLAETALVTNGACEQLTHAPSELVVN